MLRARSHNIVAPLRAQNNALEDTTAPPPLAKPSSLKVPKLNLGASVSHLEQENAHQPPPPRSKKASTAKSPSLPTDAPPTVAPTTAAPPTAIPARAVPPTAAPPTVAPPTTASTATTPRGRRKSRSVKKLAAEVKSALTPRSSTTPRGHSRSEHSHTPRRARLALHGRVLTKKANVAHSKLARETAEHAATRDALAVVRRELAECEDDAELLCHEVRREGPSVPYRSLRTEPTTPSRHPSIVDAALRLGRPRERDDAIAERDRALGQLDSLRSVEQASRDGVLATLADERELSEVKSIACEETSNLWFDSMVVGAWVRCRDLKSMVRLHGRGALVVAPLAGFVRRSRARGSELLFVRMCH
jgi:hypothetical protein